MPTRASISKLGKGPIRAEAEPDVTANHAPIQISRGAGVTLVVASLLGLAFVGWKAPSVLTTTVGGFALALAFSIPRSASLTLHAARAGDSADPLRLLPCVPPNQ
jgi:hypothetical protein